MAQRQDEIPLDPDWATYEKAFAVGLMTIYTIRVGGNGELVGYIIFMITPRHLNYDHRWAKDITIWLHRDHRNLGAATGLFDCFEKDLRKDGPIVVQIETRAGHPALEYLLQSRGYDPTGKFFGKRLA
jgi:hypothetical protein